MVTADEWMKEQGKSGGVTTEQLDKLAQEYQAAYAAYEVQKEASTLAYKKAEELEGKLVEAMELAGKQKYHVEGLGLYYFSDKMTVKTPKTNEDKKQLFNYLKAKHGPEYLMTVTSINHNTLQSLYKAEFEAATEAGTGETFHLPGLEAPTNMRSLNFRKEKI